MKHCRRHVRTVLATGVPMRSACQIRSMGVAVGLLVTASLLPRAHANPEEAVRYRSVSVDSANFRQGPCTSQPIVYTADRYYPVEVVSCADGWCKTRDFEGDIAWVSERLLGPQPAVVVTVNRANVRKQPNARSRVMFRVDWGEALKVTERKNDWVAIEDIEGERGWVNTELTWGLPVARAEDASRASEDKPVNKDESGKSTKEHSKQ